MRSLIELIIGLSALCLCLSGCGKSLKEKVANTYEAKIDGDAIRMVLQDTGVVDEYVNDKPGIKYKWEIMGKEVHIEDNYGGVTITRINADRSLTVIAVINDGKREEVSRDNQITFKKIN